MALRPSVRPSVQRRLPRHVAAREVHVVRQPPRAQLETLFQSEELTPLQFLQARARSILELISRIRPCPSTTFKISDPFLLRDRGSKPGRHFLGQFLSSAKLRFKEGGSAPDGRTAVATLHLPPHGLSLGIPLGRAFVRQQPRSEDPYIFLTQVPYYKN